MVKKYLNRNNIVLFIVLALFSTSYFCAANVLTVKWWKTATLADVMNRFDGYLTFRGHDESGRNLLMYALEYSEDPFIPMYFILNKPTDIYQTDMYGISVLDYARKNPQHKEAVKFIQSKYNERYSKLGDVEDD